MRNAPVEPEVHGGTLPHAEGIAARAKSFQCRRLPGLRTRPLSSAGGGRHSQRRDQLRRIPPRAGVDDLDGLAGRLHQIGHISRPGRQRQDAGTQRLQRHQFPKRPLQREHHLARREAFAV